MGKFTSEVIKRQKAHAAEIKRQRECLNCWKCKYHDYDGGDMQSQHGGRMICHLLKTVFYGGYNSQQECCEPGFHLASFLKRFRFWISDDYNHCH